MKTENVLLICVAFAGLVVGSTIMHFWCPPAEKPVVAQTHEMPTRTIGFECQDSIKITDIKDRKVLIHTWNDMYTAMPPHEPRYEHLSELVETFTFTCEKRTPITRATSGGKEVK